VATKRTGFFEEMGDLAVFAVEALRALPGVPRFAAEALRQAAILVRGSTFVIGAMTVFIGFTVSTFAYFFLRSAGASDYLGVFTGLTTPRASTPVMFGYVFAAKVGCGLVAEIGAMKINEEIDALESEAVNPMVYVVGTRLAGALIFVPIAVGVALLASTIGNYVNAIVVLHALDPSTFLHNHWGSQNLGDQALAFVNLGTMAMGIVIVSCFYGYRTSGGPADVGTSVARSLVVNLVLVHIVAAFYISLFYGTDPHLPIGG
jgi:phospholipid/cholesterol/gamma-HCH transport system permease protein